MLYYCGSDVGEMRLRLCACGGNHDVQYEAEAEGENVTVVTLVSLKSLACFEGGTRINHDLSHLLTLLISWRITSGAWCLFR